VVLKNEKSVPEPKEFNLAEYSRQVFRMFGSDEKAEVTLVCDTDMMDGVVDKFGTKVKTEEIDENTFKATVMVCPSPTFYRWVFGWNGRIRIDGPESVKREYGSMLQNALEINGRFK